MGPEFRKPYVELSRKKRAREFVVYPSSPCSTNSGIHVCLRKPWEKAKFAKNADVREWLSHGIAWHTEMMDVSGSTTMASNSEGNEGDEDIGECSNENEVQLNQALNDYYRCVVI